MNGGIITEVKYFEVAVAGKRLRWICRYAVMTGIKFNKVGELFDTGKRGDIMVAHIEHGYTIVRDCSCTHSFLHSGFEIHVGKSVVVGYIGEVGNRI